MNFIDNRVSQTQRKKLLDLLSVAGLLVKGRVVYKNTDKRTFWKRIAVQLNSMWSDWKGNTKKKADTVVRRRFLNHKPNFTKLELRLLKLIDFPVDTLFGVLQEKSYHEDTDKLNEESNLVDNDDTDIDNKDNGEFAYFGMDNKTDSSPCNVYDNENISLDIEEIKLEASTEKEKTNKETTEDYKAKEPLALEKDDAIHNQSEELKLKALELKLKADELKLKETEISRINYLTQLEEEKLKCMTQMAASLKELVDWTRNGNTRFHNAI